MTFEQRILEEVNIRAIEGRPAETAHHLRKYFPDCSRERLNYILTHLSDMGRIEIKSRVHTATWQDEKKQPWVTVTSIYPGRNFATRLDELRRRERAALRAQLAAAEAEFLA